MIIHWNWMTRNDENHGGHLASKLEVYHWWCHMTKLSWDVQWRKGLSILHRNWLEVAIFDGFVFDFGVEVWGTEKAWCCQGHTPDSPTSITSHTNGEMVQTHIHFYRSRFPPNLRHLLIIFHQFTHSATITWTSGTSQRYLRYLRFPGRRDLCAREPRVGRVHRQEAEWAAHGWDAPREVRSALGQQMPDVTAPTWEKNECRRC